MTMYTAYEFPVARGPLTWNGDEIIERMKREVNNAVQHAGAALWYWLRQQLETWSMEHAPGAHIEFVQGNGVEILTVDGTMIETWWDPEKLHDDHEGLQYMPLVKIMQKLEEMVGEHEPQGIPIPDLEIKAGRLVTKKS